MNHINWEAQPRILPPGIDFITEEQIDVGDSVVDTYRDFDVGVITHLSGRRYVKESTVRALAEVLGYKLVRKD